MKWHEQQKRFQHETCDSPFFFGFSSSASFAFVSPASFAFFAPAFFAFGFAGASEVEEQKKSQKWIHNWWVLWRNEEKKNIDQMRHNNELLKAFFLIKTAFLT